MKHQDNRWWDEHSKKRRRGDKKLLAPTKLEIPVDDIVNFEVGQTLSIPIPPRGLLAYIQAIVEKFDLRGYRYPMTVSCKDTFFDGVSVQLTFECEHRDTKEKVTVGVGQTFKTKVSEDLVKHLIRETIKTFVVHEMDECLHYDGKREWDPHKYDHKYF